MNIKTSCVTTHGSTVNYFCFGSGKTPMVMLPGISTKDLMPLASAVKAAFAEFEELDKELTHEFGEYHEYVNKCFNSSLGDDITDSIVDEIVEYGFSDEDNDNAYFSGDMDYLVAVYVDGPSDAGEKVDERLLKMKDLLERYDVKGALELFQ